MPLTATRDDKPVVARSQVEQALSSKIDWNYGATGHSDGHHHPSDLYGVYLFLLFLLGLLCIATFIIPYELLLDESIVLTTGEVKLNVAWELGSIVPAFVGIHWAAEVVADQIHFAHSPKSKKRSLFVRIAPSKTTVLSTLLILLYHMKLGMVYCIKEKYQKSTMRLINLFMALVTFAVWSAFLEQGHDLVEQMADRFEEQISASAAVSKWHTIGAQFASWKNSAKQDAYRLPSGKNRNTAIRVVAEIIGAYAMVGKLLGLVIMVVWCIGIDMYSNLVVIGLTVLTTGIVSTWHLNAALSNVLPLASSNAFYVGEIIQLQKAGEDGGLNNPSTHLTGFVEGITWTHVVMRDFTKRQVFVPHAKFEDLVISNWTRRPTKLCRWCLYASAQTKDATSVAQLAKFARRWIDEKKDIDQESYKKSASNVKGNGIEFEVIFYPREGVSAYALRTEFSVVLMDAARRLDVTFIPTSLMVNYPIASTTTGNDTSICSDEFFADLLPSRDKGLRRRSGWDLSTSTSKASTLSTPT